MRYEKTLKGIILFCSLYYCILNHPTPKWASQYLDKLDLFLRTETALSTLVAIACVIFFVFLIIGICSLPVLIALLGIVAKKRRNYFYGGLIVISCVLSAWEIWVNQRSLRALYVIFCLIFDPAFEIY